MEEAVVESVPLIKKVSLGKEAVPDAPGNFVLVASNMWPLSVRVTVKIVVENAVVTRGGETLLSGNGTLDDPSLLAFRVQPQKRKMILVRIAYLDPTKKLSLSYAGHWTFDGRLQEIRKNNNEKYATPFFSQDVSSGVVTVSQGPGEGTHGVLSQQSRFAWDFSCPVGTSVLCARDGVVLATEDSWPTLDNDDAKHCNRVLVAHQDGSVAVYAHLAHDSVCVREDQPIKAGDKIAASGNSGFSSGPHLHFHVAVPTAEMGWVGIPIHGEWMKEKETM